MKKIITLTIISFFLVSITGCSPNNPVSVIKNDVTSNYINVSQQKGAELTVKFDFTKSEFKTKASTNGTPASLVTDVKSAKLYLTKANTDPLNTGNLVATSGILSFSGTTQIYTFGNVPPGTYYAAVELYSDLPGTLNIIEPIVYGGTTGTKGLTVSGNSATINAVSYAFSFSDSATSFNLAPALLNAVGAKLDANVTPSNGSSTPTGSITIN